MTIPIAVALIATAVISAGTAAYSQSQQQSYQKKLRNQQIAEATRSATASATANYDQINLRRNQEREAAGDASFNNRLSALATTARAGVAASEAGVAGNSVEATMRDLYGREARINDTIATNLDNTNSFLEAQGEAIQNQTLSSLNLAHNNAVQPQPVDWIGIGAQFASSAIGAYGADVTAGRNAQPTIS